jgi:hypothetical protein
VQKNTVSTTKRAKTIFNPKKTKEIEIWDFLTFGVRGGSGGGGGKRRLWPLLLVKRENQLVSFVSSGGSK